MPVLNNSNDVKVTVSTSADTKGIKDTQTALLGLSKESDTSSQKAGVLTNAFGSFGKTIATVGAAFASYQIIDKVAAFGAMSLKSAADLQQTSKSYEVLTGNVKVANELFAQLAQYANTTPFEFPDISRAGQTLLGFGIQADQIYGKVQQLGDIAAATGANFQSLALVYGQVNAAGRLYGQDALQLINNSVPVYNILAKQMGITVKEVRDKMEEGAITADIFNEALKKTTEEGGFAFKGVDVLAKSFNGRLSTLKDTVTDFGRRLLGVKIDPELGLAVEKGGIFDQLSNGLVAVTNALSTLGPAASTVFPAISKGIKDIYNATAPVLLPALQTLWDTIQTRVFPALESLWKNVIEPLIPVLGGAFVLALRAVIEAVNAMLTVIAPLVQLLTENKLAVEILTGAFIALKAAMMLGAAFDAIKVGFATLQLIQIPSMIASLGALTATWAAAFPVAGILADIALVAKAVQSVMQAFKDLDAAKASAESYEKTKAQTHQSLLDLQKNGDAGQKARAASLLKQGYATGTNNAPTGWHVVGEQGPELVKFNGGEQVKNAQTSGQMMGDSGMSIVIQNMVVQAPNNATVKTIMNSIDQDGLLASKGMTVRQGAGL